VELHHLGLILKTERQLEGLKGLLGLTETGRGFVERYQARCVMLEGLGIRIECIFAREGPLAAYNQGQGGLHHLAVKMEPGDEPPQPELLLEKEPVAGIMGLRVNFILPLLAGLPVELVQEEGEPGYFMKNARR